MSGIKSWRAGHADDGQTETEEGDGKEGNAFEKAGKFIQLGGPGTPENKTDDEPHAGHRQPEVGSQQHCALNTGFMQAENTNHQQAGMTDHGKGQQATQIGLLKGQCCSEENAGHGKADNIWLPVLDSGRRQRQHEAQHAVDADFDADHQRRRDGNQAMLRHIG